MAPRPHVPCRPGQPLLALLVSLLACATPPPPLSRTPDTRDLPRAAPAPGVPAEKLWSEAEAVLERRCVVCHGCYDAPCQLKLETFAGLERGATQTQVYEASRLTAADPTRLYIDARLVSEWRQKGFHSVLPDAHAPDPQRSVLARMLELKRAHPLAADTNLGEAFSWGLEREQTCPNAERFDEYAALHPLWGMPYALPGLSEPEHAALQGWLAVGAPRPPTEVESDARVAQIAIWEAYLNEPQLKRQLVARYLYEHLFLASLYFRGVDDATYYRLVRSRTPSGFPVKEIASRRPFEDPGPGDFYYRLVRREGPILSKTHMPYALDAERLARYRELFDAPEYVVSELPGYTLEVAANPLTAFAALPTRSRYRFMLDEAQFTLMGFIKGPVCRGQAALNVIQERFWVAFLDPDATLSEKRRAEILHSVRANLALPAEAGSNASAMRWFSFASQHAEYASAKNALYAELASKRPGLTLDLIWNGEGKNQSAALTVFRHYDSATVVQGLVGGAPKTAWIVDYPMLERIHYLLVAGFDVFGSMGHQLLTRLYMDFLRMEGEANFLALLPRARRKPLANAWYRSIKGDAARRVQAELAGQAHEPRIRYKTAQPELELYALLEERLAAVRSDRYELSGDPSAEPLLALQQNKGQAASFAPELSFLAVVDGARTRYYSIVRESAHTNVIELFFEDERRVPAEDVLRVVPGFLGAYPNALFRVPLAELPAFAAMLSALSGPEAYRALHARFGVSRASPDFWPTIDAMHAAQRETGPPDAGLFDLNRLQAE